MLAADQTTGLDIAVAIVAGYAPLVATLALVWQIVAWVVGRMTRVKVSLLAMEVSQAGVIHARPAAVFDLVNRSDHQVKIVSWWLTCLPPRLPPSADVPPGERPENEKPRRSGAFGECRRRDSNPRHADYDSAALTD
jgi:hypothetical protein